ncbi:MAG: SPASM domain-containing protein [Deltaproteobacteria bacterium]|nr:SPASM domain-containing protein [Deltaproteobacteria bacterium]
MPQSWDLQHAQVQTISWCNRSCDFCPSQKFQRKPHLMPLDTYRRILDELAALNFCGRFSPFLQCEPLLDKRLPELVSMARETLPKAKLLIQSNGDMLTAQKGIALFEAGLHKLVINCYDNKQNRLKHLDLIATEITTKNPNVRYVMGNFFKMIRPERSNSIKQEIVIEDKTHWTKDGQENWAGNVPGIHLQRKSMKAWCFRPFNQLYVHHNGNVVLCCCDWKGDVVFGNVLDKSLVEIFSGPLATTYRKNLNEKNRQMKLCDVCDFPGKPPLLARISHRMIKFANRLHGV